MNLLKLAWRNVFYNRSALLVNVLLMALGAGIVIFAEQARRTGEETLARNLFDVDLVAGATGSPLQLILCALMHIDAPTGNIRYADAEALSRHPLVGESLKLSLGDNFSGFRIVGTEPHFASFYQIPTGDSLPHLHPFDCLLGSAVARETGLEVGDNFASAHGLDGQSDDLHEHSFRVVGILPPSGTTTDRLIFTPLASIWQVHDHNPDTDDHAHDHDHDHDHEHARTEPPIPADAEVTAILLRFRNNMGLLNMPRYINEKTPMQAALPAIEVNRLYKLMGTGTQVIRLLAMLLVTLALVSIFISQWQALHTRRRELALLRTLGLTQDRVRILPVLEALITSLLGLIGAYAVSRSLGLALAQYGNNLLPTAPPSLIPLPFEWLLVAVVIVLSALAAVLLSVRILRKPVSQVLSED